MHQVPAALLLDHHDNLQKQDVLDNQILPARLADLVVVVDVLVLRRNVEIREVSRCLEELTEQVPYLLNFIYLLFFVSYRLVQLLLVRLDFVDANLAFLVLFDHALQLLEPSTSSLLLSLSDDLLNLVVSFVLLPFDLNDELIDFVMILRIADVICELVDRLHNQKSDQKHAEEHEVPSEA